MNEAVSILKKAIEALTGESVRGKMELEKELKLLEEKKKQIDGIDSRISALENSLQILEGKDDTKVKSKKAKG